MTYSKYVSAPKKFLPVPLKEKRREWAKIMYAKYRNPEDWDRVRFSDEVYAGYSPEGHLWIARKRRKAMRYRWDNIQHRDPPPGKQRPWVYAWAAIGYNFKKKLIFYKVPTNSNGKLNHRVYIDQILEPHVRE